MRKQVVATMAVILGLASCGSSGGVAATASKGDAFCKLAASAKQDNDTLNALDFSDPTKLKLDLSAAIDSLSAAVAKAPKDIAATAQQLLTSEELVEKLLKDNNYDIAKMSASAEGKKALAASLQNAPPLLAVAATPPLLPHEARPMMTAIVATTCFLMLTTSLFAANALDDVAGDVGGNFHVLGELHGVCGPTLRT